MKTIRDIDINNKTVLIRCDLNVPIKDGNIEDDNRIVKSLETIKYALKHAKHVIIMSHLGRIKNEEDKKKNSLKIVCDRLSDLLGEKVYFCTYDENIKNVVQNNKIVMLENVRYFDLDGKKESNNDEELSKFYASLADVYINDAFGVSHRRAASTTGVSKYLESAVGFLVEEEINKLSILLNSLGYNAISLTGWQAGIITNNTNQNALIENIDTSRIISELNNNNIVIITGFQGINEQLDITTFGRGGSDTTAVAIASALKAKNCYIFSDVDGIYSSDPNKVTGTKKLTQISYDEMLELSNEGAKVLHNRCIEIGKKYKIPIITKSTFNNNYGTVISDKKIEGNEVKSIIKKDVSRISIIGNGIIRNIDAIKRIIDFIKDNKLEMLEFNVLESKISITFKEKVSDKLLEKLHDEIFNN